ncbi:hypothetical protein ACUR5C_07460 [Aliikangiella sp. IMCC44653]
MQKLSLPFIKALLALCLFLSLSVKAEQNCTMSDIGATPLSSHRILGKTIDNVVPADVFQLTLALEERLVQLGVSGEGAQLDITAKNLLPRNNMVLVYDIFSLTQFWHQQNNKQVRRPATLRIPSEVKPYHIFQWVDATHAFLDCLYGIPKDIESQSKGLLQSSNQNTGTIREEVRPVDVFQLLLRIAARFSQVIEQKTIVQIINFRMLQTNFLLEEMLRFHGETRLVNWNVKTRQLPNKDFTSLLISLSHAVTQFDQSVSDGLVIELSSSNNSTLTLVDYIAMSILNNQLQISKYYNLKIPAPPMLEIVESAEDMRLSTNSLMRMKYLVERLGRVSVSEGVVND